MGAVLYTWLDYNAVTVFVYGRLASLILFKIEPKGRGVALDFGVAGTAESRNIISKYLAFIEEFCLAWLPGRSNSG